jgi:hypothetical protein
MNGLVPDFLDSVFPLASSSFFKDALTLFSRVHTRQSKALTHSVAAITPALLQMHSSFGIEKTTGCPVGLRSPASMMSSFLFTNSANKCLAGFDHLAYSIILHTW